MRVVGRGRRRGGGGRMGVEESMEGGMKVGCLVLELRIYWVNAIA